MPPLTLYETALVPMVRTFQNLSKILKKGETFADAKGISHSEFLESSLALDMKALPFQITSASNAAKFLAVRVAGVENQPWDDNETTFEQLQERITKTLTFLEKVKREDFEGKEDVQLTMRGMEFTGLSYVNNFALPNFFFHAVTVYSVLRMKGVDVGKADWLGLR